VMREPYKSRGFPDYEMDWYGAPGGEYAPNTEGPDRQYPGSDPEFVGNELFTKRGVDVAVLHPMGRGIMPDRHLGSALHAAHNEMMVSKWLESAHFGDRFRGTIRVNPDDIRGALREIEKWGSHPSVVQIGIPMQSRELGEPERERRGGKGKGTYGRLARSNEYSPGVAVSGSESRHAVQVRWRAEDSRVQARQPLALQEIAFGPVDGREVE